MATYKVDLETYQAQLAQVERALSTDPSNDELTSLKSELTELIELTQAAAASSSSSTSTSTSTTTPSLTSTNTSTTSASNLKGDASRKAAAAAAASSTAASFAAGDEVLAKYSGDGQWYPARITSVGGSAENRVYSVVFKGYNNTELVNAAQIKASPAGHHPHHQAGAGAKRKLTKGEEEERERKKKKNEKKLEVRAAKAKEQQEKQASWQKFAKKSERKGIHIAGVSGTSIFKTPENPLGRVGVTGSGKGMTEVAPRIKHKFEITDDPNA